MDRAKTLSMKTPALFAVLAVVSFSMSAPASAASSSWSDAMGARMRVIAPGGPPAADGSQTIGLEIELEPGWKTYWRSPGDSGVPPYFDHSASANIADLQIDWPAPHRFDDSGGMSVGYKSSVVLPITIKPQSAALPVLLTLSVDYGVCKEICVPASGTAKLVLGRNLAADAEASATLARYQEKVPADAGPDLAVTAVAAKERQSLTIETRLADVSADSDLFVEGPESWYFPAPKKTAEKDGTVTWTLPLDGVPQDASLSGTELTLTLVNGQRAVEQKWRLD